MWQAKHKVSVVTYVHEPLDLLFLLIRLLCCPCRYWYIGQIYRHPLGDGTVEDRTVKVRSSSLLIIQPSLVIGK